MFTSQNSRIFCRNGWRTILMLALLCFLSSAHGGTVVWTGNPAGGAWSTGSNWSTGFVPGASDDVAFTGALTGPVQLNGGFSARSLQLFPTARVTLEGVSSSDGLSLLGSPGAISVGDLAILTVKCKLSVPNGLRFNGPGLLKLENTGNTISNKIELNGGRVRVTATNSASAFDTVGIDVLADSTLEVTSGDLPGLNAKYYQTSALFDGNQLSTLQRAQSTLAGMTPAVVTVSATVNFTNSSYGSGAPFASNGFNATDNIIAHWSGMVDIPANGPVSFYTTSDDGSFLWIDGVNTAVVYDNGAHGATTRSGTVNLTSGAHRIDIVYFEWDGGGGMQAGFGTVTNNPFPASSLSRTAAGTTATLSNAITLSAPLTINGFAVETLTLSGQITGAAGPLLLFGNNILLNSNTSNFTSGVTVRSGKVTAGSNSAFGAASSGILLNSGTTLALNGGVTVSDSISLSGVATIETASGSATISGQVEMAGQILTFTGGGTTNVAGNINDQGTAYVAGLLEGHVMGAIFDETTPNNGVGGIQLSPRAAYANLTTAPWDNNNGNTPETFIYTGEIFVPGNVISFAESIDDSASVRLDGTLVLNNTVWNVTGTSGALSTSPGWHQIEVRFGDGGSGGGPVAGNGWTTTYGFGMSVTGSATTNGAAYTTAVDNGTGTLFRYKTTPSVVVNATGGTVCFSGANSYPTLTQITAGTLELLGGSAIPDGNNISVAASGTLKVSASETIGTVTGTGNIHLNTGTLSAGNSTNFSYDGLIFGGGVLRKVGTGALTLPKANTYTGGTSAAAGTIVVSDSAALGSGSVMMDGGNVSLQSTSGTGLLGEYFTVMPPTKGMLNTLQNFLYSTNVAPQFTAVSNIDFDDAAFGGRPFASIGFNSTNFIVARWTGSIDLPAGVSTFFTTSDDGSCVWIDDDAGNMDNTPIVNNNFFQGPTERSGDTPNYSVARRHQIVVGYHEYDGGALMKMHYTPAGGTKQIVPLSVLTPAKLTPGLQLAGQYWNTVPSPVPGASGAWDPLATLTQFNTALSGLGSPAVTAQSGVSFINLDDGAGLYTTFAPFRIVGFTNADNIVARWSGQISLPAGTTTFYTTSDTGSCVWIDGVNTPVVNNNILGAPTRRSGSVTFASAGMHNIVVGFFETTGGAGVLLEVENSGQTSVPLYNNFSVPPQSFTVANNFIANLPGTISSASGTTAVLTGNITLPTGSTLTINNGNSNAAMTLSGGMEGTGTLTKTGATVVVLNGNNIHTGDLNVQAGTLRASGGTAIGEASRINLSVGAVFDVVNSEVIGRLSGPAGSSVTLASGTTLTIKPVADTFSGVISGGGGVAIEGSGRLTLDGTNTYSGATTVSSGELRVQGSIASATTVGGLGKLTGTGTVLNTLTVNDGGRVAPGVNGLGAMSTGSVSFLSGAKFEVMQSSPGVSTMLAVTGSVTVDSAAILNVGGISTGLGGPSFTIIINDGADAISGPVFGNAANGAPVSAPANSHIFFSGANASDGNDVVLKPNRAPTSADAGGPYTFQQNDGTPHLLSGSASDPDGDAFTFTWTYNNPATVTLTGTTPNFPNEAAGAYSVLLTVSDGLNGSITASAIVTVENNAPVADNASFTTNEDTQFNGTLVAHSAQPLTYSIVTNGTKGTAVLTDAATGAFTYTPNANANGSDSFTFKANNGTDSNLATVSITINSVNDMPAFTKGADQTVLEDAGLQTLNSWVTGISAGAANESSQALDFIVSNDNAALFAVQPAISPSGALTFTSAANVTGSATVTVQLHDDGGTANSGVDTSAAQTFTITVTPVNDAPSFIAGADVTVLEDAGLQTITNWATSISAGPNESGQTVTFNATGVSGSAIFSVQPAVSPSGTLTFRSASNANGTATVNITLQDNGGTANGGINVSPTEQFTIVVVAVNDPPNFSGNPSITVLEDAGPQTIQWASGITTGPSDEAGQTIGFALSLFTSGLVSQPSLSSTGVLTFVPFSNASGTANLSAQIFDNGGSANGGNANGPSRNFSIIILAVNDAPSFVAGPDKTVLEDSGPQSFPNWATSISKGPSNESSQTVSFPMLDVTPASLFSVAPSISANGTLSFTPAPNAAGTATITYKLMDSGGTSNGGQNSTAPQTFTITLSPVNDAPSFTKGADQVAINTNPQTVAGWATEISAGGADESGQAFNFIVSNDNNSIFAAQPQIAPNGTLSYTAAPGVNATATVTVQLHDNGGAADGGSDTSAPQMFTITVISINMPPSFTKGAGQTVLEDAGAQSVSGWATAISTGSPYETNQSVNFIVSNNNNSLFSVQPAVAPNGTLTYTAAANANGNAVVTVQIHDDGGTANGGTDTSAPQTFVISVTAVNDTPAFTKGADQTVPEDAGAQAVSNWATAITAGPSNEGSQAVDFVVSNNNGALFSVQPAVAPNGTLTYTPAANANGSATVTVQIHDDGGTANSGVDTSVSQTFVVNVTPMNDAPSFAKGADQTTLEDSGAQAVSAWATAISAGPANESSQTLNFIVSNNNTPLFSTQPAVAPNGTLTYTPAVNANGSATITIQIHDNGGTADGGVDTSASQTFTITVSPINDAPSFTKGADQTSFEDGGAYTVPAWATAISAGPANESAQLVDFIVSNNNNALFAVQPAVAPNGMLSYTVAANANGTATVTVQFHDNGGTTNGGNDTSTAQTFVINVIAVNDVPAFSKGTDETVLEDAGAQTVSGWAASISAGPANESAQLVDFIVSNNNNSLFSVQPAVTTNGTLTFTAAPNANGTASVMVQIHDNGGTANGGVDTSAPQTFAISVLPVNDTPSFVKGNDEVVLEDCGAQSVLGWACSISVGPANEAGQALDFIASNDNNALFLNQPAIDASGTLTYTPNADLHGSATVTVQIHDDGGGNDTSAAQTFTITVFAVADQPDLTAAASASGNETSVIPLSISAALNDNDGSETLLIVISGAPANAVFSAGENQLNGDWHLQNADLSGLTITVDDGPADITLTIDAIATEASDADTAINSATMNIAVSDVAPVIELTGSFHGNALSPYTLNLGNITDPGDDDVTQYIVHWGDGTTSTGEIDDFSATHNYAAGIYAPLIVVDLLDEDGLHLNCGSLQPPGFSSGLLLANAQQGAAFSYNLVTNGGLLGTPAPAVSILNVDLPDGAASLADVGLSFSNNTFTSPALPRAGQLTITLLAVNNGGAKIGNLIITIKPASGGSNTPQIISKATATPNPAQTGATINFSVVATDKDGDILSYYWNFGDGSDDGTANRRRQTSHVYNAPGTYDVVVTVSDGKHFPFQHLSVVIVDASENTYEVTSLKITFDFKKPEKSLLQIVGKLPVPASFGLNGAIVNVAIPGTAYSQNFQLNNKGVGGDNVSQFTLKLLAPGASSSMAKFTLELDGVDTHGVTLFSLLSPLGYRNATINNPPDKVMLPQKITIAGTPQTNNIQTEYKAVLNKHGKAKLWR